MKIIVVQREDRDLFRKFQHLPFEIYKEIPQWVPPLVGETEKYVDRKRNPFYRHSDAIALLALDEQSKAIGRLIVLENCRYNEFNREKTSFFTLFECINDCGAAQELFRVAQTWAQTRGLTRMVGPKGFTALDGLGMLVKGFEHRPAFGIPYNPPYYPELLEKLGFKTKNDIVSGHMYSEKQFPEKIHELSMLIQQKKGLHVARFKHRRDLLKLVPKLKDLYNGALQGTEGNVPLTDQEARSMANQILWFADPKFIKILMKGEEPVGFLFAYPDISAAVQRQKGKIFPFGWIDIFKEMSRTKWVNINGAGIIEQYRGMGGTAILFSEMYKSIMEGQFEHAELVQVGMENDRMQNELSNLGVDFYKTHRMYQMELQ
jgi:hypothetical protein